MNSACRLILISLSLGLLSACASGPINTEETFSSVSFEEALAAEESASGAVLWGGVILSTTNLEDSTMVEVLAYPLDRRQRPIKTRETKGRFLIINDGFLEPTDFSDGRSITVLGALDGVTTGNIAAAEYEYPTVNAEELYLWRPGDNYYAPRFSIGIGFEL